jgi:hypothetical protein
MRTSESIKEISKAMVEFHSKVSKIAKSESNPFFKSKYASLANILDVIAKPLNESKLVILQFPTEQYRLTTRLLHESGEWFEDTYEMQPTKHTPQDAGSVITYQRRYAIGAILNLNIDEDDDGNKASQPVKTKIDDSDIQNCETLEDLQKLWDSNSNWHNNNEYIKVVKAKKLQLSK